MSLLTNDVQMKKELHLIYLSTDLGGANVWLGYTPAATQLTSGADQEV